MTANYFVHGCVQTEKLQSSEKTVKKSKYFYAELTKKEFHDSKEGSYMLVTLTFSHFIIVTCSSVLSIQMFLPLFQY